jgi:hypothetical protein
MSAHSINGNGGSSNNAGSGVATTSSSSLNSYSPISSLERQYNMGQRIMLFVNANAQCCLEGGVESILKVKGDQATTLSSSSSSGNRMTGGSSSATAEFDETADDDFDAFAFLNEKGGGGGGGTTGGGLGGGEVAVDYDANGFGNEGYDYGAKTSTGVSGGGNNNNYPTFSSANSSSNSGNGMSGFRKPNIGGFFRKVATATTATLERQMQGLAVRMDKGRNPDLLRVALYDSTTQELLGVSESQPIPLSPPPAQPLVGDAPLPLMMRQDVRFQVPLIIAQNRRRQPILLKLWIQSGSAILQSTKVAKHYLLGMAIVDGMTLPLDTVSTISLSSNLVVGGQLQLLAFPDPKFSPVYTRGWSLTDHDANAYTNKLSYPPLDQSYLLPSSSNTNNNNTNSNNTAANHWIVATERATESSVVLPIAAACMELASKASLRSFHHAQTVGKILRANRHDFKDNTKATCNMGVVGVVIVNNSVVATHANVSIGWRRPDSIFELELAVNTPLPIANQTLAAANPAFSFKFYPKVCTTNILPGILQAHGGKLPPSGYLLGGLYFCVTIRNNEMVEVWEAVLGMESFVDNPGNVVTIPLHKNGQVMGQLLLHLQVLLSSTEPSNRIVPATDGLVSVMGLETLTVGVEPAMDCDTHITEPSLRHQQLATMGFFCTINYMDQHLAIRKSGWESFQERARAYKQAMVQPEQSDPFSLKSPKAFRPSSSRMNALLTGIPFNAHVASLNLNIVDPRQSVASSQERPGAYFQNITCGAPSDHARGFGNILEKISTTNVSGGLRRLEAQRYECSQALQQAQSLLIAGVGNYLSIARKSGQANHVPSRHAEIQGLRWKVFECVHNLIHVTWMCAVRRANVFSQSLGLAVTSYLTSISDAGRCVTGWPELWRRHGYLVSFEGLLSAAGKELGMIEDASVAIAMLRNVRVVLMPDAGVPSNAIQVPASPFLKWVNLFTSGDGMNRHYLLQIGIEESYYRQRIPAPLQNGTAVQLYPILFQVGVDIRQWGANTGSNLIKNPSSRLDQETPAGDGGGIVDDDDDDEGGVPDDDVLVQLNNEALRKMNAYAHAINPQSILLDKVQAAMIQAYAPQSAQTAQQQQQQQQQQILPVHPSLTSLHSHVLSSAGKMNHSILDEAATLAQQLGGGGLVFCKSGKDRTAMHLTYKQAQFAARYRGLSEEDAMAIILQDATLMRIYGTRLPICEKNVGQAKYAFNSLQVKFMPDALKPPMNTLAGFLKGGRLFGEGAIES